MRSDVLERIARGSPPLLSCAESPWRPPLVMGVVNVTPDSFYDGGRYNTAAVDHAVQLLDEGADILDIGGESTRPPGRDYGAGAVRVSEEEEITRVLPVIEEILRVRPDAVISVDTVKSGVARRALEAGAAIVNDVSGGGDPLMMETMADAGAPYILMHGHDPEHAVSVEQISYENVVEEVFADLSERAARARAAGVGAVVADVGLGFAKRAEHSIALLRHHDRFLALGVPLLVGASRKSFIGRILGGVPPEDRLYGTLAAHTVAALRGATILRVHDVLATRQTLDVLAALV